MSACSIRQTINRENIMKDSLPMIMTIDILHSSIQTIVYSPAVDVATLLAPFETLNASSDQMQLIKTYCTTGISTSCTQTSTPNFQQWLLNDGIYKFNFKDMLSVSNNLYKNSLIYARTTFTSLDIAKIRTPSKYLDVIK